MSEISHPILDQCLSQFSQNPEVQMIAATAIGSAGLLSVFKQLIPVIEKQLLDSGYDDDSLDLYQKLFREMERFVQADDQRHDIVVVVPVADRPKHLYDCLSSLLTLCNAYAYGGLEDGRYKKVSVIIADDSGKDDNIAKIRELAVYFNSQGLGCIYFGQQDQLQMLNQLSGHERQSLLSVLGDIEPSRFFHKGASITRNLCYLKLKQLYGEKQKTLFFFVDSDQEFRVNVNTGSGEKYVYAINYFYYLDQIFSNSATRVLTGKVVGDPPVSPAVMIGRFLDDVIHFLSTVATLKSDQSCQFHNQSVINADDAAYHDMADLFGFNSDSNCYGYNCTIEGQHDHSKCLYEFSSKLNRFFDGEHPTRKSYYQYEDVTSSVKPARTVYTGNYVFNAEVLGYFIPFASLKLRMAGPVLGRIIKSELADSFVSANLPMLHKRTVDDLGQSEFRPGVNHRQSAIDLHDEFERQYFGDVMLFTMEKLTTSGFPVESMPESRVAMVLKQVEEDMQQKYVAKHQQIQSKLDQLKQIFNDPRQWWQRLSNKAEQLAGIEYFIHNVEYNFADDSSAYKLITSAVHRKQRCQAILKALLNYPDDRQAWRQILKDIH